MDLGDYISRYHNKLRGGAIFIKNECSDCKVHFRDRNLFKDNYAFFQGGAISYSSHGFTDIDNSTIFINNTDSFMNKSISSYADRI